MDRSRRGAAILVVFLHQQIAYGDAPGFRGGRRSRGGRHPSRSCRPYSKDVRHKSAGLLGKEPVLGISPILPAASGSLLMKERLNQAALIASTLGACRSRRIM